MRYRKPRYAPLSRCLTVNDFFAITQLCASRLNPVHTLRFARISSVRVCSCPVGILAVLPCVPTRVCSHVKKPKITHKPTPKAVGPVRLLVQASVLESLHPSDARRVRALLANIYVCPIMTVYHYVTVISQLNPVHTLRGARVSSVRVCSYLVGISAVRPCVTHRTHSCLHLC